MKVIIRTGELNDAKTILNLQRDVITEDEYLISVPEEFNKTIEQQRDSIQRLLENERETLFVAEIDKEVVGWIAFQSPDRQRLSHTGSFGMMLHKDFRGLGIGARLIKKLLLWTEEHPCIEKVSLGVFSTNKRAIDLYKGMGFIEEGRKKKEIKLGENKYVDDVLMYKLV
ncbi:GNAT family N-acetyltransferase [Halobacillus sp. B23F22_1]|uniref:GNAT family N-acetyltransferase n=1 Tax=Halobacillus sp. B23F22_1 TaxID=3459514 RepID=UPI00373F6B29